MIAVVKGDGSMSTLLTSYTIDLDGRILWTGEGWDEFARANSSDGLCESRVHGKSIYDYMQGTTVKEIYRRIFARVRVEQNGVVIPFRCDSPSERRFLELHVSPPESGAFRLSVFQARLEPREFCPLLDPESKKDKHRFVTVCSWCKKIQIDTNLWVEVEEATGRFQLFYSALIPQMTHTICSDCLSLFSKAT